MGLNTGQAVAVNNALDAYEGGQPGHTIIGEGGTGKTFCVMEIGNIMAEADLNVLFTAPTNKAVKQLEKSARGYGLPMDRLGFKTIHSAMGLSMLPSAERRRTVPVRDSVFCDYDFMVCDEASMLNEVVLLNYMQPELEKFGLFCLLMGDNMQLPPVKEAKSLAFDLFPCSELTQVERQQNNPDGSANGILELTHPLREAIKNEQAFNFDFVPEHNVTLLKDRDFLGAITEVINIDTNPEDTRVLAWTNRRVNEINRAVREKIYGKGCDRFMLGERVVTGGPVKVGDEIGLSTDEECIIANITTSHVVDDETGESYKTWLLTLHPVYADVKQIFAHVLHEDSQRAAEARWEYLANKAKNSNVPGMYWRKFHEFRELFCDIKYCWCITVHRSQGSTYKNGMVDVKDLLDNKIRSERQRLIYVGFSRFQHELMINKTGFIA